MGQESILIRCVWQVCTRVFIDFSTVELIHTLGYVPECVLLSRSRPSSSCIGSGVLLCPITFPWRRFRKWSPCFVMKTRHESCSVLLMWKFQNRSSAFTVESDPAALWNRTVHIERGHTNGSLIDASAMQLSYTVFPLGFSPAAAHGQCYMRCSAITYHTDSLISLKM